MKKKIIVISFLFVVFCQTHLLVNSGWAQPVATVVEAVYTFEAVPEGKRVFHTFVVKNTGDSLLNIFKVEGG